MKKFYALLLLTLSGLLVMSNPVDVKLARKVAINYLNAKKGSSIDTFDLKLINTHQVEGNDALYIFALSKGDLSLYRPTMKQNRLLAGR